MESNTQRIVCKWSEKSLLSIMAVRGKLWPHSICRWLNFNSINWNGLCPGGPPLITLARQGCGSFDFRTRKPNSAGGGLRGCPDICFSFKVKFTHTQIVVKWLCWSPRRHRHPGYLANHATPFYREWIFGSFSPGTLTHLAVGQFTAPLKSVWSFREAHTSAEDLINI